MYKLIADYHTHTVYSHGKGTIQDNVEVARRKGLKKVAITDHGFGHIGYGISRKKLTQIRTQINRLNDKYGDIEILLGIEANLVGINGQVDLLEKDLKYFDIILMGFHKGAKPHSVKDGFNLFLKNFLSPIYPAGREKQRQPAYYFFSIKKEGKLDRGCKTPIGCKITAGAYFNQNRRPSS